MNRIAAMYTLFLCLAFRGEATAKLSIYDPLGVLSVEQRNSIETEGQTLVTNRKVNGQDLLIQIDFLTSEEFDKGGGRGWDKDFRNLFSLGTYTSWSVQYYARPAVLILFLDQGDGQYVLDGLNFSDKLMDEGIPDLVRRYIRDEIMKKEADHMEMISSGLYAIGEALNPVYRQRLEQKGNEMLTIDDRYQRAHCNHWSDCKYYEYYPMESLTSDFPQNTDFTDLSLFIEVPSDYEVTDLVEKTQRRILDWGHTHSSAIVSNWPWQDKGEYLKNSTNTAAYSIPDDYFPVKNSGSPLSFFDVEVEQKSTGEPLPVMGYLQIHGWKATYCNFFAYDLSRHVFGHVPWGASKRANDIHNYFVNNTKNFINVPIDVKDGILFSQKGYPVYYTKLGALKADGSRKPGHIATGWIGPNMLIQAGRNTGIMLPTEAFADLEEVSVHIYLGYLKKSL